MFQSNDDLLRYIGRNDVRVLDIRFSDLPGVMQHFTVPASSVTEELLTQGVAFDGSSVRGFQEIHESDMLLLPDLSTGYVDPFRSQKTLVLNFFVHDPVTRGAYTRDPRNIARKAEQYLLATEIADTAFFGAEAEFYVFDSVRYDTASQHGYYYVDSVEGAWNTGAEEGGHNLGHKPGYKGGYFPVPPVDHFADLRDEMVSNLQSVGMEVERAHHEVGTAGQAEINFRFGTLLSAADAVTQFKYIVKNTAWQAGKTATFMPKPLFGDNGSGMHTHQSLWKAGEPLFFDSSNYADLSDTARWYIGGLLEHAPSLLAFTNPTVNSYRRLVPGFEAPVNLVYSQRNRSACTRIPMTGQKPQAKRVEFRVPDPSANPYLAFSAMLMAGLDGVANKTEPPEPMDTNLYELSAAQRRDVQQVPGSLSEVLDALERDNEYLRAGDVFTQDLLETWVEYKRENEIAPIRQRPTPHEFALYYDM